VPKHPQRAYGGGDLHFVTFSCFQRRPLIDCAEHRDVFLRVLERVRLHYKFTVVGYVVMREHVHLLISEPLIANVSTIIKALKQGSARRVLNRLRRVAHGESALERFWQTRFYDFNVFSQKKRIEKLRYMHRNPVTRGLVESPEDWKWSSFRWYLRQEAGLVQVGVEFERPLVLRRTAGA